MRPLSIPVAPLLFLFARKLGVAMYLDLMLLPIGLLLALIIGVTV